MWMMSKNSEGDNLSECDVIHSYISWLDLAPLIIASYNDWMEIEVLNLAGLLWHTLFSFMDNLKCSMIVNKRNEVKKHSIESTLPFVLGSSLDPNDLCITLVTLVLSYYLVHVYLLHSDHAFLQNRFHSFFCMAPASASHLLLQQGKGHLRQKAHLLSTSFYIIKMEPLLTSYGRLKLGMWTPTPFTYQLRICAKINCLAECGI